MDILLVTLLANLFSVYAGIKVTKAHFTEDNPRKALVLIGMWLVMYSVYIAFVVQH